MPRPVGGEDPKPVTQQSTTGKVGELESGHQFKVLSSDSKPIFGDIPKWILNDLQTDKKPSLTSAIKSEGLKGLFSFIYYAVRGARNWRLSDTGTELNEYKPQANISSAQLGINKKVFGNQESKLEREFQNIEPKKYVSFLQKVIKRKEEIEKVNDPEEKTNRLKALDKLEQGIAAKILEFNPKLSEEPLSNLKEHALFENQRNIDKELSRLEEVNIQGLGNDIFSRLVLEETKDKEISNLKERKEQIQKEFDGRAETAKKVLSEKLSGKASEALKNLSSLEVEISNLEKEQRQLELSMLKEQKEFDSLEERQKTGLPQEIATKEKELENARKKYIDPEVTKFQKSLLEASSNLEKLQIDQKRLIALEEKRTQVQIGQKKAEGWFGAPLNKSETNEYESLKSDEMKKTKQIQDLKESIDLEQKEQNKELAKLSNLYLAKIENDIKILQKENEEIPEKIKGQKKVYEQACGSYQNIRSKYVNAIKKQTEAEKVLKEEGKRVEVELKEYARAVGFREGNKLKDWTPNLAIQPKELSEAFTDGIRDLPLPPIDLKNIYTYELFSKR